MTVLIAVAAPRIIPYLASMGHDGFSSWLS